MPLCFSIATPHPQEARQTARELRSARWPDHRHRLVGNDEDAAAPGELVRALAAFASFAAAGGVCSAPKLLELSSRHESLCG